MSERGKAIAAVAVMVLVVVGVFMVPWRQIPYPFPAAAAAQVAPTVQPAAKAIATATAQPAGVLEVVSVRGYSGGTGWRIVEGVVGNRGPASIDGLRAVVLLLDQQGKPVASDEGNLTFNPLPRGEVSPFRIMTAHRAGVDGGIIGFRSRDRALVPTTDPDGDKSIFIFEP